MKEISWQEELFYLGKHYLDDDKVRLDVDQKELEAFILKSLKKQDKKHFFELEELRLKEGGFRIKQHKIYDEKLKTQREAIIKEMKE